MADLSLVYLGYLGTILLIGLFVTLLARKLKIPNFLLLILIGIALANIPYKGEPLISFPQVFLTALAILALVMIVFDGTSKFKWKDVDTISFKVLKTIITQRSSNLIRS